MMDMLKMTAPEKAYLKQMGLLMGVDLVATKV
jgi:hypothetical protein